MTMDDVLQAACSYDLQLQANYKLGLAQPSACWKKTNGVLVGNKLGGVSLTRKH